MHAFGSGIGNDADIASVYATARLLCLANGPDELHRNQVGNFKLDGQFSSQGDQFVNPSRQTSH